MSNPKNVTCWGWLSFPSFTKDEAYALSQKGSYPVSSPAEASPSFQVLLNQTQYEKVMKHIEDTFLPYCTEQHKKGERRDALEPKEIKALLDGLKGDLSDQTYNTPLKAVHEKTAPLKPEAVAAMKVIGQKGTDMELKAIVNEESELAVPDPDILSFPVVKPLAQTTHSMYPGCKVAVTVNFYSYHNGKHPGFSAGATVAVFKEDDDRFGGGTAVDEDEIFLD